MGSAQDFARIGCALFLEPFGKVKKIGLWGDFGRVGSTFWPGELLGPKNGSEKKWFCGGMILWWGFTGIHPAQMNSMVPGIHMSRLVCPKPTLFNYFVGISSFPGKLQVAPVSLAYFPLWGPAAVAEGLTIWPNTRAAKFCAKPCC